MEGVVLLGLRPTRTKLNYNYSFKTLGSSEKESIT